MRGNSGRGKKGACTVKMHAPHLQFTLKYTSLKGLRYSATTLVTM